MDFELLQQFGVSLGLGLLVGFQREWDHPHVAGIRSFAMIPPLGTLCARLGLEYGGWIPAAGLISLAGLLATGSLIKFRAGKIVPGITTSTAALLMYVVGAILARDQMLIASVIGGCIAVLLHWKRPLHEFAERVGEREIRSIIQLVLIALVILPILPNKSYGPYDVVNPFHVWLMVVLIVGISVAGYAAYKLLGAQVGTLLSGVLGGIISSTATTVAYARRPAGRSNSGDLAAIVVMIASTVVFFRVSFEVLVLDPQILRPLAPLPAIMFALFSGRRKTPGRPLKVRPRSAIQDFGALRRKAPGIRREAER